MVATMMNAGVYCVNIVTLNTGDIPETASATGLNEAHERLKIDSMSKGEKDVYYRHLDNIVILRDNILTERAEANKKNARSMKSLGVSPDIISSMTGLSLQEIKGL